MMLSKIYYFVLSCGTCKYDFPLAGIDVWGTENWKRNSSSQQKSLVRLKPTVIQTDIITAAGTIISS